MAVYYSQTSINGFGLAMATRYSVEVSMTGGSGAYTDGKVVTMPKVSGYLSKEEFECLLGTTLHELSHCKHKSVPHMIKFADAMVAKHGCSRSLAQGCYNTIIDIADETRLMYWDANHQYAPTSVTAERLALGTYDAFQKMMAPRKDGSFCWDDVSKNTVWLAEVCAMYFALAPRKPGCRLSPIDSRRLRVLFKALEDHGVAMSQLRKLATKAITTKKEMKNYLHLRPAVEWQKIADLAEGFVFVLMPFDDAKENGQGEGDGDAECEGGGDGQGKGQGQGGKMGPVSDGSNSEPAEGASGGEEVVGIVTLPEDGEEHGGDFDETMQPVAAPQPGSGWSVGDAVYRQEHVRNQSMDQIVFRRTRTMISNAISRAAEDDGGEYQYGMKSGSRMNNFHRVKTDGAIFGRYQESGVEREAISAAILLDTSGSMTGNGVDVPSKIAAIAEAFRVAVIGVNGEANCWAFSKDTRPYPGGFARFNFDAGGTNPKIAMLRAEDWMRSAKNRNKAVIICTDGEPNYNTQTSLRDTVTRLQRQGVEVIVAYYGTLTPTQALAMKRCYPKATLVVAKTLPGLAVALKKVGRRLSVH